MISCPSCARQQFDVISTVREIEEQLDDVLTPITVSIIGCVVNGPGEARSTDVGITGGGKGTHQIYVNGIPDHVIKNQNVEDSDLNSYEDLVEESSDETNVQKNTKYQVEIN